MKNDLKILLLTEYFPPEIGAGANRAFELASRWCSKGAVVTVLTGFPDYPNGIIPENYKGRILMSEKMGEINVVRTFIYPAPNSGFFRRVLSFFSFTFSSILIGTRAVKENDVIIATSPPFSIGIAGYLISKLKNIPFIFEIRDIWPASVVQLGQLRNKFAIGIFEKIEMYLYKKAIKIITVTDSYITDLVSRGVNSKKISVIQNGVDLNYFRPTNADPVLIKKYDLENKEVIAYIGTHGLSHSLGTVIEAANNMRSNDEFVFLFVGDGAEKEALKNEAKNLNLSNIRFVDSIPRKELKKYYAISDILLVPLKKIPVFKTVLPSKIFEIMAMGKPIITSVDGECKKLIKLSGAGIYAEPENAMDLTSKILKLYKEPESKIEMGNSGRLYVEKYFDRNTLADKYLDEITMCVEN
jgi:colanic acid biosynthesis glycosyl transferase WcaI